MILTKVIGVQRSITGYKFNVTMSRNYQSKLPLCENMRLNCLVHSNGHVYLFIVLDKTRFYIDFLCRTQ